MNFTESEAYLFSLGNEVSTMKLGLENIRALLTALGNPQEKYLKIQVAGTNGKGSVCAFVDSICREAHIKTGLFTSPHLISITERIKIYGQDISEDEFARHASSVREVGENLLSIGNLKYLPTFFEQITAIALVAFAESKIDLAILETGLGGRLDATTAANAEIAAITRIDLDHQEYLGETLSEIAAEKAAIINKNSVVVIGDQNPEAMEVILTRCAEFGIDPIFSSNTSFAIEGGNTSGSECAQEATRPRHDEQEAHSLPVVFPPLGLNGEHQIENAKIAISLAELLQEHFQITRNNILDGLKTARHPGRLEVDGKYLFDGAHNVAGIRVLREFLDENIHQPMIFVFGAMKDKNVGEMAASLFTDASRIILTKPSNSRAMAVEEIAAAIPLAVDREVYLTKTVTDALNKADEIAADDDVIVVTGSLYLVGEAKKILKQRSQI